MFGRDSEKAAEIEGPACYTFRCLSFRSSNVCHFEACMWAPKVFNLLAGCCGVPEAFAILNLGV